VRKADNLSQSCAVVTKFGKLNFLEPSGPLRVSNGTTIYIYIYIYVCVCVCVTNVIINLTINNK